MRQRWRLGRLAFQLCRDAKMISGFDRIVYWGDFQNNPVYGLDEFRNQEVKLGYAKNFGEAFENYKRTNLLHGVPGPPKRAISVSNSFQTLPLEGIADDSIPACLERNFRAIYPRDPVSLERLRATYPRAADGNIRQGIDAALLLARRPPPAFWQRAPILTWHFRRSKLAEPEHIIREISRRTGLRAVHLRNWFRPGGRAAPLRILKMRSEMRSSRLVVTDVYHVAVNALALGVPVLCIARAATEQLGTLGDYKKHTLLEMFQLSDWLHPVGEGDLSADDIEAIAERASRILADADPVERLDPVRRAVSDYRALLLETILGDATAPV